MPEHVAFVFPGRRYGPRMPLLRYPAQALAQAGADVHVIEYPEFLTAAETPSEEQWEQALDVISPIMANRCGDATRVTLISKSLGTRVIARLAPDLLPPEVAAAWLTPIFVDQTTAKAAAARTWRSLYVYGTADPSCDDAALQNIVAATGGSVLAIDGGDHSLEVEGDVQASIGALARVTAAILDLGLDMATRRE